MKIAASLVKLFPIHGREEALVVTDLALNPMGRAEILGKYAGTLP